jgi:hypothetical protein
MISRMLTAASFAAAGTFSVAEPSVTTSCRSPRRSSPTYPSTRLSIGACFPPTTSPIAPRRGWRPTSATIFVRRCSPRHSPAICPRFRGSWKLPRHPGAAVLVPRRGNRERTRPPRNAHAGLDGLRCGLRALHLHGTASRPSLEPSSSAAGRPGSPRSCGRARRSYGGRSSSTRGGTGSSWMASRCCRRRPSSRSCTRGRSFDSSIVAGLFEDRALGRGRRRRRTWVLVCNLHKHHASQAFP